MALLGTLEGADMDQDDAFMDIDQQQLIGSSTTTFSAQPNNARRAPVMGNRGLESQHRVQREQERSRTKSKTFPQKEPKSSSRSSPRSSRRSGTAEKGNSGSSGVVQVAALDERNLKKAVHRYGTLPKGARIGAYLESLRQSGMTPEPVTEQGVDSDATIDSGSLGTGSGGDTLERLQGGRVSQNSGSINMGGAMANTKQQQQPMLRSNSSHGGFVSNNSGSLGGRGRSNPRTNPSQLARVGQPASYDQEAGGPSRGATIALNDLEFPPPPVDLPPPPQSFQTFQQTSSFKPNMSNATSNNKMSSPKSNRRDFSGDAKENSQILPELLARSTLEKRKELSSDSFDSLDRSYHHNNVVPDSSCQLNQQNMPKSPVSPPLSDCRTLGSPAVGSLSSPGSTLDEGGRMVLLRESSCNRINSPAEPIRPFNSFTGNSNNASIPLGANQNSSMETKLLNEIRARPSMSTCSPPPPETKTSANAKSSGNSPTHNGNNDGGNNPAAMLVTELFETIKAKSNTQSSNRIPTPEKMVESSNVEDDKHHEIDFKANLRKVKKPDAKDESEKHVSPSTPKHIDFKSQLKKTESTYANPEISKTASANKKESITTEEKNSAIVDKPSLTHTLNEPKTDTNPIIDFKSKLRKSTSKPDQSSTIHDAANEDDPPHNFQARLRKVSGTSKAPNLVDEQNAILSEAKKHANGVEKRTSDSPRISTNHSLKRDSVDSIDSGAGSEPGDDKRKSTGSITSLRKMWETNKESTSRCGTSKSPINDEASTNNSSTQPSKHDVQDNSNSHGNHTTVKFEKRVWPPVPNTETEKPMVPVKPTVKPTPAPPTTKPPPPKEPAPTSFRGLGKPSPPGKPPMAAKPNVCNIYAAPTTITNRRGKPNTANSAVDSGAAPFLPHTSHPTNAPVTSSVPATTAVSHDTHSGGSGCSSSSTSEREEGGVNRGALLVNCHNLSDTLDSTSSKLIMDEKLSKSNLMQLSEQVSDVHSAAIVYVDNIPATGRFRYRSLCNKLEEQSKELRELSIGNNKMERSNIGGSAFGSNINSNANCSDVVNDIQNTIKGLVNVIQR